jgi:DNA (cytosine-5)-methyltransferase 1
MKYLSLFSGIGGFELGINQAYENISNSSRKQQRRVSRDSSDNEQSFVGEEQLTCIGYSEIDKYASQIYQTHFPKHKNYGDITKIKEDELPEFDLIVGGFPCQSFSIAGKRGGFDDTRGTLFFEIARIIKAKFPRLLLLENVKGLLSHDEGKTFATIINTLVELGYDVQWQVLNSKNFGVPQNRERVFIVGHLRGTSRPEVFPFGERGSVDNAAQPEDRKEIQTHRCLEASEYKNYSAERFDGVLQDLRIRRLTPTECERLQGFPDGWTEGVSDTQRYKCLGNAVTVNVIKAIMEKLLVL